MNTIPDFNINILQLHSKAVAKWASQIKHVNENKHANENPRAGGPRDLKATWV